MLPLFESGIPLVRERLQSLPDAHNITIAYPDEGAWKRFHYQFGDYPEVCLRPRCCLSSGSSALQRLRLILRSTDLKAESGFGLYVGEAG